MERDSEHDCVDIYGFKKPLDYVLQENQHRNLSLETETLKNLDWNKLVKLTHHDSELVGLDSYSIIPCDLLHSMVQRGIPAALRPQVWPEISNCSFRSKQFPENYFSNLVHSIESDETLLGLTADDIKKDLHRTFPEHPRLGSIQGQASLWRVLSAFSLHNPEIGYCQSLNFLVGAMMLFLTEEGAFWLLDVITSDPKYFPASYFTSSMLSAHVDQHILTYLIQERIPDVLRCLLPYRIDLPLVCMPFFLCIFINVLPSETALRVWDMFLLCGTSALFRVTLSLFQIHQDKLSQAKDDVGLLFNELREIGHSQFDADRLLFYSYGPLSCSAEECKRELNQIEIHLLGEQKPAGSNESRFSFGSLLRRRATSTSSPSLDTSRFLSTFKLPTSSVSLSSRLRSISVTSSKNSSQLNASHKKETVEESVEMKTSSNWNHFSNNHDNDNDSAHSGESITGKSLSFDDYEDDGLMWMSTGMSKLSSWFSHVTEPSNSPTTSHHFHIPNFKLPSLSSFLHKPARPIDFNISSVTEEEIDALRMDFIPAVQSQMESIQELRKQNRVKSEAREKRKEAGVLDGTE